MKTLGSTITKIFMYYMATLSPKKRQNITIIIKKRGKILMSVGILVYLYNKPMETIFLRFLKKGPRPKWTKYKHVSDDSKKCLLFDFRDRFPG